MDAFWLRVALSFVLGGLAVALFTTAAERMGSRVGGLLLSFPVKVTIAMVLIGLNEGADVSAHAATAIPLGIGINLVFLAATAVTVRRAEPWPAMMAALGVWLVAGIAAILFLPQGILWSLAAWVVPTAIALWLLRRAPHAKPRERKGARFGLLGLLSRAAGAGTIVALAVVLARIGGPLLGGLASVFPSGWMTTMVILTRHHGPDFTAATVRVMVAGSAAPVVFGIVVWLAYPAWGVWLGSLAAIGAALVVSLSVAGALHLQQGKAPVAG
ncbi:MAG TPA: DUF3147 family protein [Candidatus Thermoplasmatota archaeon]|nr:DUF3147 family protein [Candidatus Thermoplasmatota archaeon]